MFSSVPAPIMTQNFSFSKEKIAVSQACENSKTEAKYVYFLLLNLCLCYG